MTENYVLVAMWNSKDFLIIIAICVLQYTGLSFQQMKFKQFLLAIMLSFSHATVHHFTSAIRSFQMNNQ